MALPPPVRIENLSFRYRSRTDFAIHNINLTVDEPQIVLIAGASGCGKTTLARCINGLIPRSYKGELSGKIYLQGQDIAGLPLARISQLVGTVLQDPERQILGSIVMNEVAFGLENLGLSRDEIRRRVDEALERLKIAHLRDRQTHYLSGGEKQKVALAGVLAMKPSILLLDEPLASLDPASAQEALEVIRGLADEGMTVLMVEHRVEDVLRVRPERVLFMKEGEIQYDGDPQHLVERVDYREVKLPAPMIMELAIKDPPPPPLNILPGVNGGSVPLVEFKDVVFGYESGPEVLHGINLQIRRGDVIAVLGPNGAGKTTLVKHAIGLLKPKRGQVLINGRDTHQLSVAEIASTLGYVFQSPSHMLFAPTVYDELAFGPTNLKHPEEEIRKEVSQAIEIVNLQGYEKTPPLSMSFGQQKRVSIAAILAMRSRILVMDEPTAGQDYKNYMNFMNSILGMPGFEAILFITHDLDMAVIYANRVLLVNDGQVVADGKPAEVLSDLERLRQCRLLPTSLLETNLQYYPRTQQFFRAEALTHVLASGN
ncbi:ATPase components of various ABC-type transport systems, contain duplicated ATPase [Bellilinea caldifistulae]|uniref:ABC transporter ATP-binding protein n=1 Tax=Bellilinea caldifistulae TaxID=360411 RepID=UPI000783BE22|nr:ABC transporter ATP-binding protein [Bellilinea caldifistulae]GAP09872.1 ATPase components of various ABC-type transport systems, contain duplicated ATPase [Bellilinea caldifistulae]